MTLATGTRTAKRLTRAALLAAAGAWGCTHGDAPAAFVGSQACGTCHAEPARAWRTSHHALAMQWADARSVLGRFDGREHTHFGAATRFFQRDGRFFVHTDGPGGAPGEFEVAATFGVTPLQQYLVALSGGRYQALPWAWDARPAAQGGQRFFHLYPDEPLPHDDALHWTRPQQNWNHMCAECHSTGLVKGYDAARDSFTTTWSEINVACEACHGPGSRHVAWARAPSGADTGLPALRRGVPRAAWVPDTGAPYGTRRVTVTGRGPDAAAEVEACGRCHARRAPLVADYEHGRPLGDTHQPALLDAGLFFADGQIDGEVYEYGAFLQSRMYQAGVTCHDCHDPHALALRADGDALCARCHAAERYASPAHHHHAAAPRCVGCHMAARTYMSIDVRHDHSFRVPRPELAARAGAPNTCNACHRERSAGWAAAALRRWHGPAREEPPHFGAALLAGHEGRPGAAPALAHLAGDAAQPGIARATALALLARYGGGETRDAAARARGDADALVRLGAAEALAGLPPGERAHVGAPLLRDAVRAVRVQAARALVPARDVLPAVARAGLDAALDEYRAAQQANADRPEAHMNLGWLHVELGELRQAEAAYRRASRLDPTFVPARVNLADVLRLAGRADESAAELRAALGDFPNEAVVQHAYGLQLVRARRDAEALVPLRRAAELDPATPRYAYVYALALHEAGRPREARAVLEAARRRHPHDAPLAAALADLAR